MLIIIKKNYVRCNKVLVSSTHEKHQVGKRLDWRSSKHVVYAMLMPMHYTFNFNLHINTRLYSILPTRLCNEKKTGKKYCILTSKKYTFTLHRKHTTLCHFIFASGYNCVCELFLCTKKKIRSRTKFQNKLSWKFWFEVNKVLKSNSSFPLCPVQFMNKKESKRKLRKSQMASLFL